MTRCVIWHQEKGYCSSTSSYVASWNKDLQKARVFQSQGSAKASKAGPRRIHGVEIRPVSLRDPAAPVMRECPRERIRKELDGDLAPK